MVRIRALGMRRMCPEYMLLSIMCAKYKQGPYSCARSASRDGGEAAFGVAGSKLSGISGWNAQPERWVHRESPFWHASFIRFRVVTCKLCGMDQSFGSDLLLNLDSIGT